MLRRLRWLVWKDLLDVLRSQVALLVLLTPLLLSLFLRLTDQPGQALHIPIAVVAPADCGLTRVLQRNQNLVVTEYPSHQEALARLRPGGPVLLVEVGADFDEQLIGDERPDVRIWEGASRPTQVALAKELLRSCLRQQAGQKLPAYIKPQNQAGQARDMIYPLLIVMAALTTMIISASNLVEEKEAGTLQQMLLSPAGSTELWAGKLVVSTALGTMAAMSVVALRGSTLSSFWSALGLTLVASFVFAALGGVVGLLAKGPAAASSWTALLFSVLFIPVAFSETSEMVSRGAKFSPAYYLYDGLQRTVLAQESATTLVVHFGVLMAFGAFLTLVGSRLLSRFR
ncbi:ABC transporter permease [bacterium]|nr:ABC transporter permease [bacterium]